MPSHGTTSDLKATTFVWKVKHDLIMELFCRLNHLHLKSTRKNIVKGSRDFSQNKFEKQTHTFSTRKVNNYIEKHCNVLAGIQCEQACAPKR